MKICELLSISPDEFEAFNIELNNDNHAFITTSAIRTAASKGMPEGITAETLLDEVSAAFIDAIEKDDEKALKNLASSGHEINAFHLGYSNGKPKGKGSSLKFAISELKELNIPWGSNIQYLIDAMPYVSSNIDVDRTSDILGSFLLAVCLDFTRAVLNKHGVTYTTKEQLTYCWDPILKRMTHMLISYPVLKETTVVLVPKELVEENPQRRQRSFYSTVILSKKKEEPDWPMVYPNSDNKLTEPKKMTKKDFISKNVPSIKKAIQAEIIANPSDTIDELIDFISKNK